MAKGERKEKIKKLTGGANAFREPINSLIDDAFDYGERIYDLEKATGETESVIIIKNGIAFNADMRMRITREITQ